MSVFFDGFARGFEIGTVIREMREVRVIAEALARIAEGENPAAVMQEVRPLFERAQSGRQVGAKLFEQFLNRSAASRAAAGSPAPEGGVTAPRLSSAGGLPVAAAPVGNGVPTDTPAWLVYRNQAAQRNLPLAPELVEALGKVAPDMGIQIHVHSGGQGPGSRGRVGARNHDFGRAADVDLYMGGRRLNWESNPDDLEIYKQFLRRARAAGINNIGIGQGYMVPGRVHLGIGREAIWGADKTYASAPDWARQIFYGGG